MSAQKASRREFLKAAAATAGAGLLATTGLEAGIKTAEAAVSAVPTQAIEPTGTMWGLNYAPHVASYHRMADLFKKLYGSTITVYPQPYGYTNEIAAIAAGTQPDIICQNGQLIADLALQGALTEIRQSVYTYNHITVMMNANGLLVSPTFTGDAIQPFSLGNSIYGVPLECDGGLGTGVAIPEDQVQKLGLAKDYPPGNGQIYFDSYDQLYALAKALQVTKNGRVVRYGLCGEGWDLDTVGGEMLTMGVDPFDAAKEQFNFNTPEGIQAMQYHVEIPVSMGIEKEWNDSSADIDQLLNGNAAIGLGNISASVQGDMVYHLDFVITGMPKIDGKTPLAFGEGQGWGIVGPIKPQHPNLQLAFLRMTATAAGQFAYDTIYGGQNGVAWKDFILRNTSRYIPANSTNPSYVMGTSAWFKNANVNCTYIGRAGYIDRVDAAIFAACQAVREKKLTSAQAMALAQEQCVKQYQQYKIDLTNLQ